MDLHETPRFSKPIVNLLKGFQEILEQADETLKQAKQSAGTLAVLSMTLTGAVHALHELVSVLLSLLK